MSTRSCIARVVGDGWRGVYCHSDGYPTCRGQEIWQDVHRTFGGDAEEFLKERIDKHPKGWSQFLHSCYCHDPQWAKRNDPDMVITHEMDNSPEPLFIEWVYVLAPRVMTIFAGIPTGKTVIMEGARGPFEQRVYRWEVVTQVSLLGPEPDWQAIEDTGDEMSRRAYVAVGA